MEQKCPRVVPTALILITYALPYPLLVVSFVVSVIAVGENFDASYKQTTEMPLFISNFVSLPWSPVELSCLKTA